jgi:hypothetical protein
MFMERLVDQADAAQAARKNLDTISAAVLPLRQRPCLRWLFKHAVPPHHFVRESISANSCHFDLCSNRARPAEPALCPSAVDHFHRSAFRAACQGQNTDLWHSHSGRSVASMQ